ncbi:MAG TPA: CinA family protein [Alphaproteobacteria bacterium]|jgi:nicotinamide-nucleotide amidase|nr:CinA family protein [Alphaproteobacteria bacterium]MDP6270441.1 CinA family protein [Alphaproteobacteria bacterium]MDP7428849.1 CinA family protein [Alphaproteobacteria bacterium]HJM49453.1 CinA family protein [Alphaproteobacteria bacterium]
MYAKDILDRAERLLAACRQAGQTVAFAESCSGGLIGGALTEIAGSSDVVIGGFVVYANSAKQHFLGVDRELLANRGAVDEAVARAMAEGARERARASLSVAVTGIAGPGGGGPGKPVGLVHMAAAGEGLETRHQRCEFGDIGRTNVRLETVRSALDMLLERQTALASGSTRA